MSLHDESTQWPSMYKRQQRAVPKFPAPARSAWERLRAGLAAAPSWAVPCRDDGHGDDWLTDHDPAAIARAVEACGACPLLAACRDFAEASRAPAGVWGGHAYTSATTRDQPTATAAGA